MDSYLTSEIIKALAEGNMTRMIAFVLIFVVLWLELKGLKNQLKLLNTTISNSFAAGEKRFESIEKDVHSIREDVDVWKKQLKPLEGNL